MVLLESVFVRQGLLFTVRFYRRIRQAMCFFPKAFTPFAKSIFQLLNGCFCQLLNSMYAHAIQLLLRLLTHHGYFIYSKGPEKGSFPTGWYFQVTIGFGFVGGHFAYQ